MFKVYAYINDKITLLLTTFHESKVINIIQEYLNPDDVHFIVVKQYNDMVVPYKSILSEKEFQEYVEDYDNRIMKKSNALDLKREIIDLKNKRTMI